MLCLTASVPLRRAIQIRVAPLGTKTLVVSPNVFTSRSKTGPLALRRPPTCRALWDQRIRRGPGSCVGVSISWATKVWMMRWTVVRGIPSRLPNSADVSVGWLASTSKSCAIFASTAISDPGCLVRNVGAASILCTRGSLTLCWMKVKEIRKIGRRGRCGGLPRASSSYRTSVM